MLEFASPTFSGWAVSYTAIGVAVFWAKWGRSNRLRPYVLSNLIALMGLRGNSRTAVEFVVFMVIGCLVAIGVVAPHNPAQAIAAGLGWTGALTYPERSAS